MSSENYIAGFRYKDTAPVGNFEYTELTACWPCFAN